MALRLMEVIIPAEGLSGLFQFFEEKQVLGVWSSDVGEEKVIVRALLKTEQTEAISDFVSRTFGSKKGFRLMLFAVEDTLPVPEEPQGPTEKPSAPKEDEGKAPPGRISREELYQDVAQGSELTWTYIATVFLSTVVATFGLMRDDITIIIGAMVIAPLLGPNVALSLASTLGDNRRFILECGERRRRPKRQLGLPSPVGPVFWEFFCLSYSWRSGPNFLLISIPTGNSFF
jgi:hypothetical protein